MQTQESQAELRLGRPRKRAQGVGAAPFADNLEVELEPAVARGAGPIGPGGAWRLRGPWASGFGLPEASSVAEEYQLEQFDVGARGRFPGEL